MTARLDGPELSAAERQRVDRIEAAPAAEEALRERVAVAIHLADHGNTCPYAENPEHYRLADAALAVVRGETS